jgi:hypothetical protein
MLAYFFVEGLQLQGTPRYGASHRQTYAAAGTRHEVENLIQHSMIMVKQLHGYCQSYLFIIL